MRERLIEFLKQENKSSALLAEEIGVQASGISHILSGRNNPSLDFILKMLEKYPFLSTDWLLFGTGTMYKDQFGDIFNNESKPEKSGTQTEKTYSGQSELNFSKTNMELPDDIVPADPKVNSHKVLKIVWFYNDNRFEEFFPRK